MIVIDFTGKIGKKKAQLVEQAVHFAALQLMPRMKKPVFINIKPVYKLAEKKGIYGDVMDEEDREFTIRLDLSISKDELVSTTLHEMVHVWQYLTKRMVHKWVHEVRFNKVVYEWNMPYDDRPWEVEAHSLEKQLMEKWNDNRNRESVS